MIITFYYGCSLCWILLSIWAIIQLSLMGLFYNMEATVLIEDVTPSNNKYSDYEDFLVKTKENYAKLALNCWIVAGIYVPILCLACACLIHARWKASKEATMKDDDEYFCNQWSIESDKKIV